MSRGLGERRLSVSRLAIWSVDLMDLDLRSGPLF
jgi:hypothetical protein